MPAAPLPTGGSEIYDMLAFVLVAGAAFVAGVVVGAVGLYLVVMATVSGLAE